MSNQSSKFKTTQEEREDLLKYQLLHQAQQAKRYYEDGMYKPNTILNQELKKQQNFYDMVDVIASRMSSELYNENTAEGRYYKDVTVSMAKNLSETLVTQLKQGILTPAQYNDILGYIASMIGVALAGQNASLSRRRLAMQKDPVGMIVNNQLKLNLTQLSTPAIMQLAETAKESTEEIKRLKFAIQHELANALTVGAGGPSYPQNISQPIPNSLEGERIHEVQDYEGQNVSKRPILLPDTNNKHGMNYEQYGDGTESMNSATERYGLNQLDYEIVNRNMNKIIELSLNADIELNEFAQKAYDELRKLKMRFKNLNVEKALRNFTRLYAYMIEQKQNQNVTLNNHVNSAQAVAGDETARLNQEYDDYTSKLDDKMPFPKHGRDAQNDATMGNLTIKEQFVRSLEALPRNSDAYEILKEIDKEQQPATFDKIMEKKDRFVELLISELKVIESVQNGLNIELQQLVPSDIVNQFKQDLIKLRNLFDVETLKYIEDKFKKTDYEQWNSYIMAMNRLAEKANGNEKKLEKYQADYNDKIEKQIIGTMEDGFKNVIEFYQDSMESYPMVWGLKRYISSTVIEPYESYKKWINALPKNVQASLLSGMAPAAKSAKGKIKAGRVKSGPYIAPDWKSKQVYYKVGAPAMTASILNKNPVMRFTAEVSSPPNI